MAWDEEVKTKAVYDVLASVVVAVNAYENAILLGSAIEWCCV